MATKHFNVTVKMLYNYLDREGPLYRVGAVVFSILTSGVSHSISV